MISVLIAAIVRYAGSRPELVEEEERDQAAALAAQTSPSLGFYLVVLALAFLSPKVAAFGFLVIAVVGIARTRGGARPGRSHPLVAAERGPLWTKSDQVGSPGMAPVALFQPIRGKRLPGVRSARSRRINERGE